MGINGANDSTSGSEEIGDDSRSDEIMGDFMGFKKKMMVTVIF